MNRLPTLLMVVLVGLVSGCAAEPVLEVLEARQALATARDAQAPLYAPEEYELASLNLTNALAAIELQSEEPMWARNFVLAADLLDLSIEQATAAIAVSDNIRLDTSYQVEQLMPEVQELIDTAFAELEQARSTNVVSRNQITGLDDDLQYSAQLLRETQSSFESADYPLALTQAQEAIDLAESVRVRSVEINLYALEVALELEQQTIFEESQNDPFGL